MNFKKYILKKGKHRSGFFANFHIKLFKLKYEICFSKNCIYNFGDIDDFDINKLFGISLGFHHKNSIRFGWNIDKDLIAIHSYCYKNGERFMNKLISIPTETIHTFEININNDYYELKIFNQNKNIIGWSKICKQKTINWGYLLFPYFGGNKCAPHDMEIKMKRIYN